jgi:hypothetical protein
MICSNKSSVLSSFKFQFYRYTAAVFGDNSLLYCTTMSLSEYRYSICMPLYLASHASPNFSMSTQSQRITPWPRVLTSYIQQLTLKTVLRVYQYATYHTLPTRHGGTYIYIFSISWPNRQQPRKNGRQ